MSLLIKHSLWGLIYQSQSTNQWSVWSNDHMNKWMTSFDQTLAFSLLMLWKELIWFCFGDEFFPFSIPRLIVMISFELLAPSPLLLMPILWLNKKFKGGAIFAIFTIAQPQNHNNDNYLLVKARWTSSTLFVSGICECICCLFIDIQCFHTQQTTMFGFLEHSYPIGMNECSSFIIHQQSIQYSCSILLKTWW